MLYNSIQAIYRTIGSSSSRVCPAKLLHTGQGTLMSSPSGPCSSGHYCRHRLQLWLHQEDGRLTASWAESRPRIIMCQLETCGRLIVVEQWAGIGGGRILFKSSGQASSWRCRWPLPTSQCDRRRAAEAAIQKAASSLPLISNLSFCGSARSLLTFFTIRSYLLHSIVSSALLHKISQYWMHFSLYTYLQGAHRTNQCHGRPYSASTLRSSNCPE